MQEGMASTMASCKTTLESSKLPTGENFHHWARLETPLLPNIPHFCTVFSPQPMPCWGYGRRQWPSAFPTLPPCLLEDSPLGEASSSNGHWSIFSWGHPSWSQNRSPGCVVTLRCVGRRNTGCVGDISKYTLCPTKKNRVVPSSNWSWPLWWKDTSELAICKENFEGPLPDFQCPLCWCTFVETSLQRNRNKELVGIKSKGGSWDHQGFSHCHSRNPVERDPSFWAILAHSSPGFHEWYIMPTHIFHVFGDLKSRPTWNRMKGVITCRNNPILDVNLKTA